ncbi:MAG TPA: acyl-CoA thioesterase [Phycisphaerae bacterium]|nr:acyl-CoA thioesterase [Phycisphaerae bacterium]
MKPKPPRDEPAIRVVMMPRDTNAAGTIFGGVILSYIDQAAFVEARRQACHRYVTVMMNRIEFKQPVYVGDTLSLYAETTEIGRTSIHIHVKVVAERFAEPGERAEVTQADAVFVAMGADGRPTPIEKCAGKDSGSQTG